MQEKKKTPAVSDLGMLLKYKEAGFSDAAIGAKLGMTEDEVKVKWAELLQISQQRNVSGYVDLTVQFTVLCHQYQLLGESMKIVAGALGNMMPPNEIKALITADPEQTFKNLSTSCIILRPFVQVDPEQSLQESLKKVAEGN